MTVGSSPVRQRDTLAGEEPLELRVGGRSMAVTMRTPGADFDLAAGFLVSEGVISRTEELVAMRYCAGKNGDAADRFNVLDLDLASGVAPPNDSVARAFFTSSSCGLCGKASIAAVHTRSIFEVRDDALRVTPTMLASLPERLRAAQRCSTRPAGCTRRHSSAPRVNFSCFEKMSDGTTPSTRSSDGPCAKDDCRYVALSCWSRAGRRSNWCRRPSWRASHALCGVRAVVTRR